MGRYTHEHMERYIHVHMGYTHVHMGRYIRVYEEVYTCAYGEEYTCAYGEVDIYLHTGGA